MGKARLETEITGSSVDFNRSVEQAEKRAESFTGRVESLFRRTGSIRAERSIDAFAQRLAAGDIVGGLESIASRMTGLGFAAAVGLGTASAFSVKLGEDISKNNEKIKALSEHLEVSPETVAGLGGEGVKKQVSDVTKSITELVAARESWTHKIAGAIPGVGAFTGIQDVIGMIKEFQGINRLKQYFDDAAKSAERGNQITQLRITGHEQEAKAIEAIAKAQEKVSQIELGRLAYEAQVRGSKLPKSEQDKLIDAANKSAEREKSAASAGGTLDVQGMLHEQQQKYLLSLKDIADVARPRANLGSPYFNRSDEYVMTEGVNARGYANVSPQALYNARQARLVESLRSQADELVKTQADTDPHGPAARLREQADVEARKITTLKDSEKSDPTTAFEQALTATTVPKLDELIAAVKAIPLTNR